MAAALPRGIRGEVDALNEPQSPMLLEVLDEMHPPFHLQIRPSDRTRDCLSEANKKAKLYEVTSDIDTAEDTEVEKAKSRKRRKKFTVESSTSNDEEEEFTEKQTKKRTILPSFTPLIKNTMPNSPTVTLQPPIQVPRQCFPPVPRQSSQVPRQSSQVPRQPSPVPRNTSPVPRVNKRHLVNTKLPNTSVIEDFSTQGDGFEDSYNMDQNEFVSKLNRDPPLIDLNNEDYKKVLEKVNRNQTHIMKMMEEMMDTLKEIKGGFSSLAAAAMSDKSDVSASITTLFTHLPIKTEEDFVSVNELLKNIKIKQQLIKVLSLKGGVDVSEIINTCMDALLKPSSIAFINYSGRVSKNSKNSAHKVKNSMKDSELIGILNSVIMKRGFALSTPTIKTSVKAWFDRANDAIYHKIKRAKPAEEAQADENNNVENSEVQ